MRYGAHSSQVVDLWPGGRGRGLDGLAPPVAVVLHGGFWRAGFGKWLERRVVRDLVERGWAVANVEYRRVGGGGGFPATLDDVRAAHDAVLEAPGIDPSRVACLGHSAGGHLALWLAGERPLRAVVAQAAIADLELAWTMGTGGTAIADLLGGTPDQVPDRYAAASPARRGALRCPLLAVHGARDEVVPRAVATRFAEQSGGRVELVEGEGHYAHLRPASRSWQVAAAFLDAHR